MIPLIRPLRNYSIESLGFYSLLLRIRSIPEYVASHISCQKYIIRVLSFHSKKRRGRHIIISAITYIKCSCGTCVCINPYRSRSQHAHGWMRDEYRCLFWIVRDGNGIRINSNNTDWMEGFPFTILSWWRWWWWSGRDPHQDSAPPEVILEEDPQCCFSPSTTAAAVWQVKHDWHHMRLVKRNKMKGSHEETKQKSFGGRTCPAASSILFLFVLFLRTSCAFAE